MTPGEEYEYQMIIFNIFNLCFFYYSFYRQARLKEKDEQVKKLKSDLHELEEQNRSLSPTLETYDSLEKTLDVFISYRRSNGSQLASLIKLILEMRNFSVFLDVDR